MPTPQPNKTTTRKGWLKRFLGNEGASEAERALADLESALDNANVTKKALRLVAEKGVMESMQADMGKVLAKYVDAPAPELINEVIATVLSAMLPTSDEPMDEELMAEEELIDDGVTDEMIVSEEAKGEMAKAYRETSAQLATVAKDVREQNESLAGLTETFMLLAESLKGVRDDVSALKAKVNATPRRVTENTNGIVNNAKAQAEMKSASEPTDTFWGQPLPVKGGK